VVSQNEKLAVFCSGTRISGFREVPSMLSVSAQKNIGMSVT